MPALLQVLRLIMSLGGGLAAERGVSSLISKFAGPAISKAAPKLAASTLGKAAGGVGRFGAQTAAFGAGQYGVEQILGQQGREPDETDVDLAASTPYPGAANNSRAMDILNRQADLREALMAMGVEGLV